MLRNAAAPMTYPTPAPPPRRGRLSDLARPGIEAVRRNWRPFLALQVAALVLVVAYFQVDVVTRLLDRLADLRTASGVWFAMISAPIAGALLPEIAKALTQPGWRLDRARVNELTFLVCFFPLNGLLVDRFYHLMAVLFGDGNDVGTVLIKSAIDQYVFTPFVALPIVALGFAWRRHGFRLGSLAREIAAAPGRWYVSRVVTLMLPGWCFWGPMVLLIYALPAALQVVLWAGAMGAWSLIMVFISKTEQPSDRPVPPPA